MKKIFVYGSLKEGFGNHRILGNAVKRCNGITLEKFTMLDLGSFPGVILEPTSLISGEVYDVTEDIFNRVERLEGYPSFYNRKEVGIRLNPSTSFESTELIDMYYLENSYHDSNQIIQDGIWLESINY